MNSPIIYQVLFGLLFLFFCYVTYLVTRTWRWPHVTSCFFVFVAALAVCVMTARTNATHMAWKQKYRELTERLYGAHQEQKTMLRGDLKVTVQDEDSIHSLNAELGRTLLDRGRVWRNCTPTQADANTVTVSTVAPGATETVPNRIDQGTVLYAFFEGAPDKEDEEFAEQLGLPAGTIVPSFYVGEFTAAAVTDDSVTLQWTMPLTDYERRVLSNMSPETTLTLYETIPVDGHRYFATDLSQEPNLSEDAAEEPVFGKMDEPFIRQLFQPFQTLVGDGWETMIQPYIRDGRRADEANDDPENTWLKVRFTKNHTEEVDSAGDPLGAVTQSETFFSGDGLANVPLVRRAGEAEFKPDDFGVFPTQDGNRLEGLGVCETREPVYVRPLHNYDYAIRSTLSQVLEMQRDQQKVARNTAAVTESNRRTLEQTSFREQEKQRLNEDLAKIQLESQKVTAYADTLEKQKRGKMTELSRLYRSNLQLARELARVERELTDRINRRSAEATGETGAE